MPKKPLSELIKKNLLDIQYSKYLQYFNTCIILLFTYLIAVIIGFMTKQIHFNVTNEIIAVIVVSIPILSILLVLMSFSKKLMKVIFSLILNLV